MFSLQINPQIILTTIIISGCSIFENENDANDNPSILDKIAMDSSKYLIMVESKNQGSKIHPFVPDLNPSPMIKESPAAIGRQNYQHSPRKPNQNDGITEVKKPEYDEDILVKGIFLFEYSCLFTFFSYLV